MVTADFCVIGAGIVGLATARELLRRRPGASLVVLEKEASPGLHQTGHNSGVIHSGIYYEPGSFKAELCRRGAALIKQFADEHQIARRTPGKLIVAVDEREHRLMLALHERSRVNGVKSERLSADQLRELEPRIRGVGALLVPEAGIIDYREVAQGLASDIERAGGTIRTSTEVNAIAESADHVAVSTIEGLDTERLEARQLVVCGGLQADRLAHLAGLVTELRIIPFRGEYFQVPAQRRGLVSRLIYPVPDPALPFLGVHLSPTVDGRLTIGPNAVLGMSREGYRKYSVTPADLREILTFPGMWRLARRHGGVGIHELVNSLSKRGYLHSCRRYCPELSLEDLRPHPAGIRAQAVARDGSLIHDFVFGETPRSVHVLNAPSPAATSALPIGAHISTLLLERRAA